MTQTDDLQVTGLDTPLATTGGQAVLLMPNIGLSSAASGTVSVTLLFDPADGQLSVADLPAESFPTLIQRADVSSTVLNISGDIAVVQEALSNVKLLPTSGLSTTLEGSFRLVVDDGVQRRIVGGSLSVAPGTASSDPFPIYPPLPTVPTAPVVPPATFTQQGSTYTVTGSDGQTATISTGTDPVTITGGAAALDFTGGNATLQLQGSGATDVKSLGGNTVFAGTAPVTYESGGSSAIHIGQGTIAFAGGSVADTNMVMLDGTPAGTATITNTGAAQLQIFGGSSVLDYTGGAATVVLNGTNPVSDATVRSTGAGVSVWMGKGALAFDAGGNSGIQTSGGSVTVTGGTATDRTVITLNADGQDHGAVSVVDQTASQVSVFGGTSDLSFSGGNATLVVNGAATTGAVHVDSTGGNTLFGGSEAIDVQAADHDVLVLGSGTTTVTGGEAGSKATIWAGGGSVFADGHAGSLEFNGADGYGVVIGGSGSDTVRAGSGGGWFGAGTGGNSLLQGGSGTCFLQGAANGDTLVGGSGGNTWMQAGAGNETLVGGNASGVVTMQLGSGTDRVLLSRGDSAITTGTGSAEISSGGGTDLLSITAGAGAIGYDHDAPGGSATIAGFRVGTDHLRINDGANVTALSHRGGGTTLALSDGGSITLSAVTVDDARPLFG